MQSSQSLLYCVAIGLMFVHNSILSNVKMVHCQPQGGHFGQRRLICRLPWVCMGMQLVANTLAATVVRHSNSRWSCDVSTTACIVLLNKGSTNVMLA